MAGPTATPRATQTASVADASVPCDRQDRWRTPAPLACHGHHWQTLGV